MLRTAPWLEEKEKPKTAQSPTFGEGPLPPEFDDLTKFSHRDRQVSSIIDVALWNKAKWRGTGYLHYGPPIPPLFGIMFTDEQAARQIFEGWRKRFGSFDRENQIRIAILTGVQKANPHAYKVVIGTDPRLDDPSKLVITASRINEMTPAAPDNLNYFLSQQKLAGSYGLVPLLGDAANLRPATDLAIGKTKIIVRPAWQVGDNDPDLVALHPDDDVIIPPQEKAAPFLKAIERMKNRKG